MNMRNLFNLNKAGEPQIDPFVEIDAATIALNTQLEEATEWCAQSKLAADRCRAELAGIDPADLQAALLDEMNAGINLQNVQAHHQSSVATLENQKAEFRRRAAAAEQAAKIKAYREALMSYRDQCAALIGPALNVRKLAAEASEFLPAPNASDLLFDLSSEPHIAGVDVPFWHRG